MTFRLVHHDLGFTVVSARNGALLERSSVPRTGRVPGFDRGFGVIPDLRDFQALQVSDLERAYQLLEEGGVEGNVVGVKDMDGNVVQLFGHD